MVVVVVVVVVVVAAAAVAVVVVAAAAVVVVVVVVAAAAAAVVAVAVAAAAVVVVVVLVLLLPLPLPLRRPCRAAVSVHSACTDGICRCLLLPCTRPWSGGRAGGRAGTRHLPLPALVLGTVHRPALSPTMRHPLLPRLRWDGPHLFHPSAVAGRRRRAAGAIATCRALAASFPHPSAACALRLRTAPPSCPAYMAQVGRAGVAVAKGAAVSLGSPRHRG